MLQSKKDRLTLSRKLIDANVDAKRKISYDSSEQTSKKLKIAETEESEKEK